MSYTFKDVLYTRHGVNDTICISTYHTNGTVTELLCGGITHAAKAVESNSQKPDTAAIWSNIQRLKPEAVNRRKAEIEAYVTLLIDIDRHEKVIHADGAPCPHDKKEWPTCGGYKCNATDAERAVLLETAQQVKAFLHPFGEPTFADSGNGYHLQWHIGDSGDWTKGVVPETAEKLYRELLALLKAKFEKAGLNVEIDASLSDATQVVTVWGTWNRKYPNTADRPQRQSGIISIPQRYTTDNGLKLGMMEPLTANALDLFLIEHSVDLPAAAKDIRAHVKEYAKANPEWLEDYGASDLVEYFAELGFWESEGSGSFDKSGDTYYPVKPCYCHEGEPEGHTHSQENDCCIIEFADGGIGISCFASHDLSLKGVIKRLNEKAVEAGAAKYPHLVFEETEADRERKRKEDADILAAFAVEEAPLPTPPEPKPEPEEPQEPQSQAGTGLKYPDLLLDFETVCYPGSKLREFTEEACKGGDLMGNRPFALSPGFVVPALITLASAVPIEDEMLGTRINVYTCLLSMSRAGKDVSWNRAGAVMRFGRRGESEYWMDYRPGGHAQMISLLGDSREKGKDKPTIAGPRKKLGLSPELSGVMQSAQGKGSHMFETFNEFLDQNLHTTKDRMTDRLVKMDCRFSWGTSLAIGIDHIEERRFTKVFGDDVNGGFSQRLIFGFSETAVDPKDLEEWHPKGDPDNVTGDFELLLANTGSYLTDLEHHIVLGYADGVRELFKTTKISFFSGSELLFKKVMLVIACINLHDEVTTQDFEAALAFMRWQQQVRNIFKPSQAADSPQAKAQETILRALRRVDNKLSAQGKSRRVNIVRQARRNGWALENIPIGLERTVYALKDFGELELDPKTDSDGNQIDVKGRLLWDWQYVTCVHHESNCWCGKEHKQEKK